MDNKMEAETQIKNDPPKVEEKQVKKNTVITGKLFVIISHLKKQKYINKHFFLNKKKRIPLCNSIMSKSSSQQ